MNFGRYWNRLSFRLPLLIILFSILIGVVVGSIAIVVANQSLEETFKEDMAVLRNERARRCRRVGQQEAAAGNLFLSTCEP